VKCSRALWCDFSPNTVAPAITHDALSRALVEWQGGLGWALLWCGPLIWPGVVEHEAQPEQSEAGVPQVVICYPAIKRGIVCAMARRGPAHNETGAGRAQSGGVRVA
jgi:hypothetical protein